MPLQREIFVLATAEKVQMPCIKFFRYFTARRHSQCQGIGCNIEQMNMFAEFARRRRGFLFPFSECYFLLAPIFLSFIRDLYILHSSLSSFHCIFSASNDFAYISDNSSAVHRLVVVSLFFRRLDQFRWRNIRDEIPSKKFFCIAFFSVFYHFISEFFDYLLPFSAIKDS